MKTISGIEFASEHNGTDVFRLIELAYEQGRKDGHSEQLGTNLAEVGTDLISRAAAQTELQLSARRYTVAHEAHGEGRVVWSEDLISVSDAMDVLRKIPSAQPTFDARDTQYNLPIGTDCISRQAAIDALYSVDEYNSRSVKAIKQLPSIQPEIVRCKDCKYWNNGSCECREITVNCQDYMVGDIETEPEHFCGYAKRKEVTT